MSEELHPEIPCGTYCEASEIDEKTGEVIHVLCPYWKENLFNGMPGGRCEFLKRESKYGDDNLIWDKVKCCGINKKYKT
jgi:hypothetical protein